jgi:hypothetical protein
MKKLLKIYPFLPKPHEGGKLALALLFYLLAIPVISVPIAFVLGFTILLFPIAMIFALLENVYVISGAVFAIMSYAGYDFEKNGKSAE